MKEKSLIEKVSSSLKEKKILNSSIFLKLCKMANRLKTSFNTPIVSIKEFRFSSTRATIKPKNRPHTASDSTSGYITDANIPVCSGHSSRLPFLNKTKTKLNENEIATVEESVRQGEILEQNNGMLKMPSRLQQIRTSFIEAEKRPLAVDLEISSEFIIPTIGNKYNNHNIPLEKDDSIISLNDDDNFDDNGRIVKKAVSSETNNSLSTQSSNLNSALCSSRSISARSQLSNRTNIVRTGAVTKEEIKDHVWELCDEVNNVYKECNDTAPFTRQYYGMYDSNGKTVTLHDPPGRRKALRIIHQIQNTISPRKFEITIKPIPEKYFSAVRMRQYCEQNHLWNPAFFDQPVEVSNTSRSTSRSRY
ncbi:hypothetical protein TRFO_31673 [Tritrichomonas foetus]|uniref:Uncharacterized protein n=1 Tax=Tritrichomonas foetus TaxID=1144522 RepID=A0A1J4JQN7_9EUKA|nr:hypothetical protein TRFO_31673 [Tritrichomonas foetus]|eukprot:OHT01487.1 hypothetical protein TRFO_31673 [Tritrichomonas foetus]